MIEFQICRTVIWFGRSGLARRRKSEWHRNQSRKGEEHGRLLWTTYFIMLSKINTNLSHQLINYSGSGYLLRICQLGTTGVEVGWEVGYSQVLTTAFEQFSFVWEAGYTHSIKVSVQGSA